MKKLLSFLLIAVLAFSLVACADPADTTDTRGTDVTTESGKGTGDGTDTETGTDTGTDTGNLYPRATGENLVIACDQANGNRVVIYDMATYDGKDLDNNEVWSFSPSLSSKGNISGVKYRTGTVFGDVVIIVCSGGYAGIVKYPSKEVVWETAACGTNPHSIEILPSGNVVTASSTGGTLRLYYSSDLLKNGAGNPQRYMQYQLPDAHGVLWDPEYNILWAAGAQQLKAYSVSGEGSSEVLKPMGGLGGELPKPSAHDLSADMLNVEKLFITTGTTVISYDKEENKFYTGFSGNRYLNHANVKGFGNNVDGNFFYCIPNQGKGTAWENASYADWCTDTIYFACPNGKGAYKTTECKSGTCAYYKVFCFAGQYQ